MFKLFWPLQLNHKQLSIFLLFCVLVSTADAKSLKQMLFSPGNLMTAHQKFDDTCDECHNDFSKTDQTTLCRDCHEEIDKDLSEQKGFHGLKTQIAEVECKYCHSDHKGRDYDAIGLDTDAFPHRLTNFPLKNKHAGLSCSQCHSKKKTYRLKNLTCNDCHERQDPHKGNMGEDCADCHNSKDWADTTFDHTKTDFSLTFKHKDVACTACHLNELYKKTPTQCVACHAVHDIHSGRLKDDCSECHSTKGWSKSKFDHDRDTEFSLRDAHRTLTCKSCHVRPADKEKLPKSCNGCHAENDMHNGNFGKNCDSCHNEKDWIKARFDHDKETKFPLLGEHKTVSCRACHAQQITDKAKSHVEEQNKLGTDCADCHARVDPHEESLGMDCNSCHSETAWHDVLFSHELTLFPLLGMHRQVSCDNCHLSANYSKTSSSCQHCHGDLKAHDPSLGDKCEQCHNPNDWNMWIFDHGQHTDYPLSGGHEKLKCNLCHQKQLNPPTRCNFCHRKDDVHRGAFGQQCQQCHTVESFNK